jgi:ADP-glucose pyrophosphorylase
MGVYIFKAEVLVEEVIKDAKQRPASTISDGDIIPQMVGQKKVFAYNFQDQVTGAPSLLAGYRPVGRLLQGPPGPAGRPPSV